MTTEDTLTVIIDRTLSALEKNVDRLVSDMTLIQTMEFIGTLQDMRERQVRYAKKISHKRCVRMGLKNGGNCFMKNKGKGGL